MKRQLLLALLLALLAAVVWIATVPDGRARLIVGVSWLRDAGLAGVAVFTLLYVASVLAFVPATWSAALAGYLYGPALGIAISLPATIIGASAAFLVGRFLARDAVAAFVARRPRLRALDAALAEGGWKLVTLLRLCSPHNFLNYGLAASRVSFGSFALGTMAGGWPLTVMFCIGGSLAASVAEVLRSRERLGAWPIVITVVGVLAALLAFAWIGRAAQRALRRQEVAARAVP